MAVDQFSNWPTVKICKTAQIEVKFSDKLQPIRNTRKNKVQQRRSFISKEYKEICRNRNIEIEYCTPRLHTGNGTVERAIETIKKLEVKKP